MYLVEKTKKLKPEKVEIRKASALQWIVRNMGVWVDIISSSPGIMDFELMEITVRNEKSGYTIQLLQGLAQAKDHQLRECQEVRLNRN